MGDALQLLTRILKGALNEYNQRRKRNYVRDTADTLANGGRVQQSNKTIADLSDESERNSSR